MDNIIEPNESFDFSKLSLAQPFSIQGGAYFTKIEYNKKQLYIQTCKTQTKQGFVKTGKKYYCDLMLDKSAVTLIDWFEKLQDKCQELIYEKKTDWFQNNLEESDIENAFNAIIRVYKSGKYYLVRTNVRNTKTDEPLIKIYNENHNQLSIDNINSDTDVISIIEITGIKFTSRNFQIEIDLKQMMVIESDPVFDNCLIKPTQFINKETHATKEPLDVINTVIGKEFKEEPPEVTEVQQHVTENPQEFKENLQEQSTEGLQEVTENPQIDIMDLDNFTELDDTDELKEINLEVNLNNLETLNLKKPNQVYFELYKEARNKAKIAKKNAILAFLEAKKIKNTYMLENINDSDSDFDAEIEEVSESELEGL